MKKFLAILLVAAMVMTSLTACGKEAETKQSATESKKETESKTEKTEGEAATEAENTEVVDDGLNGLVLPLCDEKVEITVLVPYFSALIEDPNDIAGVQAWEERTNVHVNWITYETTEMLTKWPQILATGEYPDVMFPGGLNLWPDGNLQGIEDGIILDVNEYKEYFPNYFKLLDSNPLAYKQAADSDGIVHVNKVISGNDNGTAPHVAFIGSVIRSDILEDLGLEIPETIDELHDACVKCRDELGMSAPIVLEPNGTGNIMNSWGVSFGNMGFSVMYNKAEEKATFCALEDGFYDYVATMAQWYQEGLIDKNFTTPGSYYTNDWSSFENNESLYYANFPGSYAGATLYDGRYITNEKCFVQPVKGFLLTEDSTLPGTGGSIVQNQPIFINAQSKVDKEILCKWVDYFYTTENINYRYYGIEGESYTVENGEYVFTDKILHNEDNLTVAEALGYYAMRTYMCFINDGADARVAAASSPSGRDYASEAGAIWKRDGDPISLPEGVTLTTEEQDIVNTYKNDIKTVVDEYITKTILGQMDKSKEELQAELESYGIYTVIEQYQKALDRFNAQ